MSLAVEKAIESLVEAGLSPEDAFDTYSAVSVHVRGSVVLQRLYDKNRSADDGPGDFEETMVIDPETTPLLAKVTDEGPPDRRLRREELRVRPRLHPRPRRPRLIDDSRLGKAPQRRKRQGRRRGARPEPR